MANKYRRDPLLPRAQDQAPSPALFQWARSLTLRQRLTLVYLGIAVFSLLLLLAHKSGHNAFSGARQLHHGVAEVVEKHDPETDGGDPLLQIRFLTRSGTVAQQAIGVEEEVWGRFQPGDRIGVVYRQNWSGSRVQVVDTGLFALPPETR